MPSPSRHEVVFVEYHKIPVLQMHPLVTRLDAAGGLIHAKVVLERAEAHDGASRVAFLVAAPVARHELPALEVNVALEIFLPGGLDRRFESEDEHALHVHALGELVGGKRLTEAHLGIPEKLG